jgi:DNA/RNA-binding domain of Phe-tRNA-synthetase-like protein
MWAAKKGPFHASCLHTHTNAHTPKLFDMGTQLFETKIIITKRDNDDDDDDVIEVYSKHFMTLARRSARHRCRRLCKRFKKERSLS